MCIQTDGLISAMRRYIRPWRITMDIIHIVPKNMHKLTIVTGKFTMYIIIIVLKTKYNWQKLLGEVTL